MKDLVIPARRIRCELRWLAGSLAAACVINAYAIVRFSRPWSELLTQAHRVLALALGLWLLSAVLRAGLATVRSLVSRRRAS